MKKRNKRIAGAAVSAMMLMSALPVSDSLIGESRSFISAIIAEAAYSPNGAELTYDMGAHPEKYFTVSSNTNDDGGYTIIGFQKPDKYKDVALTTLTIPAKINGKTITRIKYDVNNQSRNYTTPAISDNDVTKIVLSSGIRALDTFAIGNCPKLKTIELPSSFKEFGYQCVSNCKNLSNFYVPQTSMNPKITDGFLYLCPKMKEAWSDTVAVNMLKSRANITKINGTDIIKDNGNANIPGTYSTKIANLISSSYKMLEENNADIIDKYYRIYSRYLLSQKIKVNDSMSFNQKVKLIYNYVISNVSYDNDAFYWEYDNNGKIKGYKEKTDTTSKTAGSIFFTHKAVCLGYAKGLNYLFREAGITSFIVDEYDQVTFNDGKKHPCAHSFNVIRDNGMYFLVDATCEKYGYMMNLKEINKIHTVDNIMNWVVANNSTNSGINEAIRDNLSYALGDVNHDGIVNGNDRTVLKEYINATESQKNSIAKRYNLSKSQFEWLADADCDGKLNNSNDGQTIWNIQQRFKF